MRRSPCRRICYAAAAARGAGVPGRDAPLCRRIQALVFPAQLAPRNPEARMNPLVSIIIPCFNAEHWVSAAIESALGQTWRETEVIAINDGSSDGSPAVLRRYVGPRVQVIDRPNRGAAAARNAGMRAAKGEFIQFLDADDLLTPAKIASQVALLGPKGDGVVGTARWARFQGDSALAKEEADSPLFADLAPIDFLLLHTAGGYMMHPAAWLVPSAVARAAGPWDEALSINDDGEYFARVALAAQGPCLPGAAGGRQQRRTVYRARQLRPSGGVVRPRIRDRPAGDRADTQRRDLPEAAVFARLSHALVRSVQQTAEAAFRPVAYRQRTDSALFLRDGRPLSARPRRDPRARGRAMVEHRAIPRDDRRHASRWRAPLPGDWSAQQPDRLHRRCAALQAARGDSLERAASFGNRAASPHAGTVGGARFESQAGASLLAARTAPRDREDQTQALAGARHRPAARAPASRLRATEASNTASSTRSGCSSPQPPAPSPRSPIRKAARRGRRV